MQILVEIGWIVKPYGLPPLNINTKASVSMQYILKHFKTVGKLWRILEWGFLHIVKRSISEMMHEPSFTKIHSHKKRNAIFKLSWERSFITLPVLKHLSFVRKLWPNLELEFLTLSHQEHCWNEVCCKLHLYTFFPKRNATFHFAFNELDWVWLVYIRNSATAGLVLKSCNSTNNY